VAKNLIQFQKGMSIPEFMDNYGTEQKCRDTLFKMRWPNGFVCPRCGNKTYCEIKGRKLLQCNRCHHQTSLIADTIFQSTHLPLKKWFLAIFPDYNGFWGGTDFGMICAKSCLSWNRGENQKFQCPSEAKIYLRNTAIQLGNRYQSHFMAQ
jgi:ribosomal protein L37AE/L43A